MANIPNEIVYVERVSNFFTLNYFRFYEDFQLKFVLA